MYRLQALKFKHNNWRKRLNIIPDFVTVVTIQEYFEILEK